MDELKQNVITLIQDCLQVPSAERQEEGLHVLVGKNVKHRFSDSIKYKGCVISVVSGFGDWYNIQYEEDTAIYAYNLCNDYKEGDLELLLSYSLGFSWNPCILLDFTDYYLGFVKIHFRFLRRNKL